MAPLLHEAKVLRVTVVSEAMRTIDITKPAGFTFAPGQFISFEISDLKGGKTYRSYSIASHPEDGHLALCVSVNPDPASAGYTFLRGVREGDALFFRGPFGRFVFEPRPDRPIIFIAGGSGIAPVYSMLLDYQKRTMSNDVYLYYGVREENDVCFRERFEHMCVQSPQFHFIPCVSGTHAADGSAMGRVTDVFDRQHTTDISEADFYLCGSPPMVQAAKELLASKGVEPEHIRTEAY